MSPRRASSASSAADRPLPRASSTGTSRADESGTLEQIALALAPLPGEEFIGELTRHLARTLDLAYAFVAEDPGDGENWTMVSFSDGRIIMRDRPFRARFTPYEAIRGNGRLFVADHISRTFPADAWLRHHGVVSFLGLPLIWRGETLGAIGVMDRAAITSPASVEAALGVLAARTAGLVDRRRIERKLREDEQRFRLIADHAIDVVFRLSLRPRPHFDYVSPSVTRLIGHTPEEFLADPNVGLRMIHPDDRDAVVEQARDPAARTVTVRLIGQTGDVAWVDIGSVPVFAADGSLEAVEAIAHDVTERERLTTALRESERRHRTIVDAIPDMCFRIDAGGRYLEFVPGHGVDPIAPPDDFVGRTVLQVLPESAGIQGMQAITRALRTGEMQTIDYELPDEQGVPRRYETRVVPVADDEVIAFVRTVPTRMEHPGAETTAAEREIAGRNAYGLTAREMSVLTYIARGAADKQIAEALGLSAYTVNKHVASILSKMHVSSRTAAGVKAVREGIAE